MTPEQRRILADLLIQWEDLFRQGQDTPAELLCAGHPELAGTLTRQIAALKRVAWLDERLQAEPDEIDEAAVDDPRPAKLLAGRYRLDELIATGGFAEVWKAYDQELQRIIAIKIPKRTVVGSADAFLAEARRVARLKHPAIVPVHDVGLEGDDCFFVSEYVEGGSLADRLTRGGVSGQQAVGWGVAIAEALDHAHRSGIIHRDVKPANILIDAHDRALLADFGIAQSSMKTGRFAPSLGTLRYMAPEQLDGGAALPQSDLYSLAVVLHEALAGTLPYSSSEPNVIRGEIAGGRRKPWSASLPRRVVPVLAKALNPDPRQRHESAAEFAGDLRRSWASPTRRFRRSAWPAAAAMAACGVAAFLVLSRDMQRSTPAEQPARQERPTVAGQPGRSASDAGRIARAVSRVLEAKGLFDDGNYAAAVPVVEEAIELDASVAQYHHYLGACHFNMQDYTRALAAFDTAARLEPDKAEHHLHRGYCLARLGRQEEARQAFAMASGDAKTTTAAEGGE